VAERTSALQGHYETGRFGEPGEVGVTVREVEGLVLHQVAAWPDNVDEVAQRLGQVAGVETAPGPCATIVGDKGTLLRVEPLKWWLLGAAAPDLGPEDGSTLDLSHSRTHLRVAGPQAQPCLNRLLPVDLRHGSFVDDRVATTTMHHVAVTVWRSRKGFELFLPRGFAASLWEVLFDTAVQFGLEVE